MGESNWHQVHGYPALGLFRLQSGRSRRTGKRHCRHRGPRLLLLRYRAEHGRAHLPLRQVKAAARINNFERPNTWYSLLSGTCIRPRYSSTGVVVCSFAWSGRTTVFRQLPTENQ